jgi:L-amino acid N-acyltransferase YncA
MALGNWKGDDVQDGQLGLVIREARIDDAAGVVAVLNPIVKSGAPVAFDAPITEEAERRYIAGFPQRGVFHVAVRSDDGAIVGFQSMEPFATYTHAFDHVGVIATYVGTACRRRGVASRLFAATFAAARRKGYEKILTYIRADNPAALATYAKHGFRVVGRAERHVKIGGQYIDEIIVERFL